MILRMCGTIIQQTLIRMIGKRFKSLFRLSAQKWSLDMVRDIAWRIVEPTMKMERGFNNLKIRHDHCSWAVVVSVRRVYKRREVGIIILFQIETVNFNWKDTA